MANAARIPVLMYHRVGEPANRWEHRLCVRPERFAAQMRRLRAQGFTAVSVEDYVAWQAGRRRLPPRSVLITFDDGFEEVYQHAVPVLREVGWPAAVFLVTARVGETDSWDSDANPDAAAHRLLDVAQIQAMRADGWSFHVHSRSHRKLTEVDDASLRDEVAGALDDMECLGTPAKYFCYPYGGVDARVVAAVRAAGYEAGFTTRPGFSAPGAGAFEIPRIEVWGTDTPELLLRKIAHGAHGDSLPGRAWFAAWEAAQRLLVARLCSRLIWRAVGGKPA